MEFLSPARKSCWLILSSPTPYAQFFLNYWLRLNESNLCINTLSAHSLIENLDIIFLRVMNTFLSMLIGADFFLTLRADWRFHQALSCPFCPRNTSSNSLSNSLCSPLFDRYRLLIASEIEMEMEFSFDSCFDVIEFRENWIVSICHDSLVFRLFVCI